MVPYNYTDYIEALTSLVNMNIIPMTRIDDAVRRILRVKFTMGLFENPLADLSLVDQLGKKVIHFYHLMKISFYKISHCFMSFSFSPPKVPLT